MHRVKVYSIIITLRFLTLCASVGNKKGSVTIQYLQCILRDEISFTVVCWYNLNFYGVG